MKSKLIKKSFAILFTLTLLVSVVVPTSASTVMVAEVTESTIVKAASGIIMTPYADVIVVKTRIYNGRRQYRRWNETRGYWVDANWINM